MEVLPDALTVAWVLAVVAGVALLLSMRTPRLGSRLGWVYPVVMAVASVAVLVVDAAWWLTRSDPRAAAVAGVAGLWLWVSARERVSRGQPQPKPGHTRNGGGARVRAGQPPSRIHDQNSH